MCLASLDLRKSRICSAERGSPEGKSREWGVRASPGRALWRRWSPGTAGRSGALLPRDICCHLYKILAFSCRKSSLWCMCSLAVLQYLEPGNLFAAYLSGEGNFRADLKAGVGATCWRRQWAFGRVGGGNESEQRVGWGLSHSLPLARIWCPRSCSWAMALTSWRELVLVPPSGNEGRQA